MQQPAAATRSFVEVDITLPMAKATDDRQDLLYISKPQ